MKRIITVLIALIVGVFISTAIGEFSASAQLRYYKRVATYDNNGVKTSTGGQGQYIMFLNNGIAYECDKNGKSTTYGNMQYKYRGTRDGKLVYQGLINNGPWGFQWSPYFFLYVTPDYKRINHRSSVAFVSTTVYELSTPEDEVSGPDVFY